MWHARSPIRWNVSGRVCLWVESWQFGHGGLVKQRGRNRPWHTHIAIGSLCVLFQNTKNTGLEFLIQIGVGQGRQPPSSTHDTRTHAIRKRGKRRLRRWAAPAPAAPAAAAPAGHNRLNLNHDRPPVKKHRRHGLHAAHIHATSQRPIPIVEPPPPPRLLPAAAGHRGPRPAGRAVRGAAPAGAGGIGPEDRFQVTRCSASPVSVYRGGSDGYLTQPESIDQSTHMQTRRSRQPTASTGPRPKRPGRRCWSSTRRTPPPTRTAATRAPGGLADG